MASGTTAALGWGCQLLLLSLLLGGCAAPGLPPVAERSQVHARVPGHYQVQQGDTLYSIAWRFGLDIDQVAAWNQLAAPYLLQIGQRLRLAKRQARTAAATERARSSPPSKSPRTPASGTSSPESVRVWRWPVRSRAPMALVLRQFEADQPGLTFKLPTAQAALAAGAGTVVYAGNGLGGYGHLVILRHGQRLLSAYSFDGRPLVAEGDEVALGGRLAAVSGSGPRAQRLYFEMRRNGRPVDPRQIISP